MCAKTLGCSVGFRHNTQCINFVSTFWKSASQLDVAAILVCLCDRPRKASCRGELLGETLKASHYLHLDPTQLSREEHFARWQEVLGRGASVHSLSPATWELLSDYEIWQVPDATITSAHLSPFEYRRQRATAPQKTLALIVCIQGELTVNYNHEVIARAGKCKVLLGAADFDLTVTAENPVCFTTIHLQQPALLAASTISDVLPVIELSVTQGLWEVLALTVQQMQVALRRRDQLGTRALFRALESGIDELAKPHYSSRERVDGDRVMAIAAFIDEQVRNPDLGVDMLCERFHMSRATLYRQMQHVGGVKRYMQARRLARCFDEMRKNPELESGYLRALVRSYHFRSFGDFANRYQQYFGVDPVRLLRARHLDQSGVNDFADEQHPILQDPILKVPPISD